MSFSPSIFPKSQSQASSRTPSPTLLLNPGSRPGHSGHILGFIHDSSPKMSIQY